MAAVNHLDSRRSWAIVAAAAATNFVAFGVLFSFGVYLRPIADTFGTGTGPVAPIFAGAVACYYTSGAVGGRLGDRYGIRPVLSIAGVTLPLGLLLTSQASELWQVYLAYIPLVGVGVGCCYAPLIGTVGRWFDRRRSMAMAILLSGVAAGTLAMPSIGTALTDAHGWRTALATLGVVAALCIWVTVATTAEPAMGGRVPPAALREVATDRRFVQLYISVVLIGPGFYLPLAFLVDYATGQGISSGAAAVLVGMSGGTSLVARLVIGAVGHGEPLRLYRTSFLTMTATLVLWFVSGGSYVVLAAAAVLHGVGWAAWVIATPAVMSGWFDTGNLGGVIGVFYTGLGLGALIGPPLGGALIDEFGHLTAIAVTLVFSIAACLAAWWPMPAGAERTHRPTTSARR